MPSRIIDEMPTIRQVEEAPAYQIVVWNHYLRPTMMNEELNIVKAIARRYDMLNEMLRTGMVARARREYET